MELESGFRAIRNSVGRQVPPDALRQSLLREFARTSRVRMRRFSSRSSRCGIFSLQRR